MNKRTKAQYTRLYDDPTALFPNVETTLFPNGAPEIWFKTADGLGFRIKVGNGPAGMGIEISNFAGTPKLLRTDHVEGEDPRAEATWIDVMQYRPDAFAQAFKAWYAGKAEYPGTREEFEAKQEAAELKRLAQGLINIHSFDHSG